MEDVKRIKVLVIILLLTFAGYIANDKFNEIQPRQHGQNFEKLDIDNKIHSASVTEITDEYFIIEVDFQYNGKEKWISMKFESDIFPYSDWKPYTFFSIKKSGRQQLDLKVKRNEFIEGDYALSNLKVILMANRTKSLDEVIINKKIVMKHKPGVQTLVEKFSTPKPTLKNAVRILDAGGNAEHLDKAKVVLDKLLLDEPGNMEIYIELARYHMKRTDGKQGYKSAETILKQSLNINDKYANTHVLLGYVYTHLNNYKGALAEFQLAEKLGTDNLWLYTNWAELYTYTDSVDDAYNVFDKVLSNERSYSRNDRALEYAYTLYIRYLKRKYDFNKAGQIIGERSNVFSDNACYRVDYADHLITYKRDIINAEKMATSSVSARCNKRLYVNKVLSKILLVKSLYHDYSNPIDAEQDYRFSKTLYQDESRLISELSKTNKIGDLYHRLKSKWNVDIDDVGSNSVSALAYCVSQQYYLCIENLISNGAKPNQVANSRGWSLLMIAVTLQDVAIVKRLLIAGANSDYVSNDGYSAHDVAKFINNHDIETMLKNSSKI